MGGAQLTDPHVDAAVQQVGPAPTVAASSQLLARFRARSAGVVTEPQRDDAERREGDALAQDVRRFLWGNGGRATSDEVVEMFRPRLATTQDKFAFRSILRTIADLSGGVWRLKAEFDAADE